MNEKLLKVSVVSPEKTIYSGECEYISIPGTNGSFGVLWNHAPLVSSLDVGIVQIRTTSGVVELVVDGGFVEVKANAINILASSGDLKENINLDKANKQLEALLTASDSSQEAIRKAKIRVAVHKK
jgi:F-type H+-transporting ATPase subunit epsilon